VITRVVVGAAIALPRKRRGLSALSVAAAQRDMRRSDDVRSGCLCNPRDLRLKMVIA
jgi:hypothetical protein